MEGIFGWATAGWISFLVYAHYFWKHAASKDPGKFRVDTIGAKQALWGVAILSGWIVLFGMMSGALLGPAKGVVEAPPTRVADGGSAIRFFTGMIAGLAIFISTQNIMVFVRALLPERRGLAYFLSGLFSGAVLLFVWSQMGFLPKTLLSNNIFLIVFFSIVIVPLGFAFRRDGVLTIFALIMVLDVYLVWLSGQSSSSQGKNWYMAMIESDLMRNWPIPIALFSGRHMLGGGDMGFIAIGLIFAYREFGKGAAMLFALLSTLPLLLLPSIKELLDLPQTAWPYTIFIAPWAILLGIVAWWRKLIAVEAQ